MSPKSAKYMHVRARRTARKKRNQFFIGGEILPQSTQVWKISLSTYGLKKDSYFKPPKNKMDHVIYLHLGVLSKIFTSLEYHNLMIAPSKMALLTQDCFEFLGFNFIKKEHQLTMSMPDRKIKMLLAFERPKTVLELQRFIGFVSFFSCLLVSAKALLGNLLRLLRKDSAFRWGDLEQSCFDKIKEKLVKSTLEGYTEMTEFCSFFEIWAYVDWAKSSGYAAAMVFTKCYKQKTLKPALCWSRLLSSTFKNKAPFLCELASICLFLVSTKSILGGRCVNILSDNLVACHLLRRGVSNVDEFQDGVLHRLLLSITNLPFQVTYTYTCTKNNPADFLSRNLTGVEEIRGDTDLPLSPSYYLG